MIQRIKETLYNNPDLIMDVLERYGFYKPHLSSGSIRCGFSETGGINNISIKLRNNESLFVKDFVRGYSGDIFAYIQEARDVTFKDVITVCKEVTGITESYSSAPKKELFGGFYSKIKHKVKDEDEIKTYDDSVMDKYNIGLCMKFFKDGIGYDTQRFFDVRYDDVSQRIVFPIKSPTGDIIGIKGRRNYETENENDPKYLYLTPCNMSKTLYGYSEHYKGLSTTKIVLIFESEKSVMLAHQYGYENSVALGSNNLSEEQAKLIMQLNPDKIYFLLDKSLPKENTLKDASRFDMYKKFHDMEIYWWNWEYDDELPDKSAPVDCGKELFEQCLELQTELI